MYSIVKLGCFVLFSFASGLTPDELSQFQSRSVQETNTNLQGSVSYTISSNVITFTSNGVPDHATGKRSADLTAQNHSIKVPFSPTILSPSPRIALPSGIIGIAINGVPIYNPYNSQCCASGVDAKDDLDMCWGNVDDTGRYYYSVPPLCLQKTVCNVSQLYGVALDGFPIYGPYNENGDILTTVDLDQCHGRTDSSRRYRYHVTPDFPYMIGCFAGVPIDPVPVGSCTNINGSCTSSDLQYTASQYDTVVNSSFPCCSDSSKCNVTYNAFAFDNGSCKHCSHLYIYIFMLAISLYAGSADT